MPRYWFIIALGSVIVFAALFNYLNQPVDAIGQQATTVASVDVGPRPQSADAADAERLAAQVAEIRRSMDASSTNAGLADGLSGSGDADIDQASLAAIPVDTQRDPQRIAADAASPDAGSTDADDAAPLVAEAAAEAGIADRAKIEQSLSPATAETVDSTVDTESLPTAPMRVASEESGDPQAGTGWLVETSGGLSAAQIGRVAGERGASSTELAATPSSISETVQTSSQAGTSADSEVNQILQAAAEQARQNLGQTEGETLQVSAGVPTTPQTPIDNVQVAAISPDSGESLGEGSTDLAGQAISAFPGWERDAADVPPSDGPMVAVIIDDLGWSARRTSMVSTLATELTLAMLTDADDAPRQAGKAREDGHELLIHLPMQSIGSTETDGSQLNVEMSEAEIRAAVDAAVDHINGAIGINNHMGSLFTADEDAMRVVLDQVRQHGLVFIDSLTTAESVAEEVAEELGVPYLRRDVFLDNERDSDAIALQLSKLEEIAERRGWAVAIGHPYIETIDALASWIPTLKRKGIELMPISTLIRLQLGDTQTAARPTP